MPESLRERMDEQVAHGRFASASEHIRHLLREDRRRLAEDRLEELIREGLDSPSVTMTDDEWDRLKARVAERGAAERRKKTG